MEYLYNMVFNLPSFASWLRSIKRSCCQRFLISRVACLTNGSRATEPVCPCQLRGVSWSKSPGLELLYLTSKLRTVTPDRANSGGCPEGLVQRCLRGKGRGLSTIMNTAVTTDLVSTFLHLLIHQSPSHCVELRAWMPESDPTTCWI